MLQLKFRTLILVGLSLLLPLTAVAQNLAYPQAQGWKPEEMRQWYELSQGSRFLPWNWLPALRGNDGSNLFERKNLEALGYTYFSKSPDALPIGFVKDVDDATGKEFLGFNCSSCHTGKLKANGTEVIIHGGQSMADFQSLTTDVISAVARARRDDKVFEKFAGQVLERNGGQVERDALKAEMDTWLAKRERINATGNDSHWGRGRTDAVGVILATTATVVADPNIPASEQEPLPASNAPVSFPFVWNANQQGRLQHNGVVDNGTNMGPFKVAKIGALIRNWTEALGVFAEVRLNDNGDGVKTSIRMDNLLVLEQVLAELQSPRWPDALGKLDDARRQSGANLFKANCSSCHANLESTDTQTFLPLLEDLPKDERAKAKEFVRLIPVIGPKTAHNDFDRTLTPASDLIGTDPGMACNSLTHTAPSGRFEGKRNVKGFVPLPGHAMFGERAVTTDLMRVLIQHDIHSNKVSNLMTLAQNQFSAMAKSWQSSALFEEEYVPTGQNADSDPLYALRQQLTYCATVVGLSRLSDPENPLPVYKARPLNGIWATAPYLHNGSVPTLYDLLLPHDKRPKRFSYLDGEMDLVKGGLKDHSGNPNAFEFQVYDKDGRAILGNWNGGHDYGTTLSEYERNDLVEYLKGL